jgi:hypothetical protein
VNFDLSDLQYLPWVVGLFLLIATGFFFGQFSIPSWRLHRELKTAIQRLDEVKKQLNGFPIIDIEKIGAVMTTDELRHLWSEYSETLHPQKRPDESGQLKTSRYRATAMAEVFFSEQALVETEVSRHDRKSRDCASLARSAKLRAHLPCDTQCRRGAK